MRARLIAAARELFADKGYAETSTPDIVRAADVTRGALYHHFSDKADLFRAVARAEAAAVVDAIESVDPGDEGQMAASSRAFFAAMKAPGRARILLIDGIAVLGAAEMNDIDAGNGRASLHAGLAALCPDKAPEEVEALAKVLSAAYDRAALEISEGADEAPFIRAFEALFEGLAT
ncbi:MAG: helix-turn-helix domain-containing protein [Pseudomonadota bacterium]